MRELVNKTDPRRMKTPAENSAGVCFFRHLVYLGGLLAYALHLAPATGTKVVQKPDSTGINPVAEHV
jgi:hypothetical protein